MMLSGGTDLARLQAFQRNAASVRKQLDVASTEMTSGKKTDLYRASGGNLNRLYSLERDLARNETFSDTITLTESRMSVMQDAMEAVQNVTESFGVEILSNSGIGHEKVASVYAEEALAGFRAIVAALNTSVAGQRLFGGIETSTAPLADADDMLSDLDTLVAGAATSADVITAVDAYFAKPGGDFYTSGYLGSDIDLAPTAIGESMSVDYATRADQDEFVAALRAQALGAVIARGALAGDELQQIAVIEEAGTASLSASNQVIFMRSALGVHEQTVERARARNIAEHNTLELAQGAISLADEADAAARVMALETQLQSLYTITGRLQNLSFTNYMR